VSWESVVVALVLLADGGLLLTLPKSVTLVLAGSIAVQGMLSLYHCWRDRSVAFTLLLGSCAFGLVALCEMIFLKDVFVYVVPRSNTVFKFYFQSWTLLAITCGAALSFLPAHFRLVRRTTSVPDAVLRGIKALWMVGLLALILASAVYPLAAPYARYVRIDKSTQRSYLQPSNSLDGVTYLQTCRPPSCAYDTSGDYAAIRWLGSHVSGDPTIVEAIGGGIWSNASGYGRIAIFTGLPTVMGWMDHEYQWRVNWLNNSLHTREFQRRQQAVDLIYTSPHPSVVLSALAQYHVRYLYVGFLERYRYPHADLQRFRAFMQVVYSADGVTIYAVKGDKT
jgi:uncharacterized membrane protein